MKTTLVVGASRGLGRGFVEQCLARGDQVVATTRTAADAGSLLDLADGLGARGRLRTLLLDVADAASRQRFAEEVGDAPLHTLIHNAGIYGPRGLGPGELPDQAWREVLHIDTVAPLLLAQAVLPQLRASARQNSLAKIAFLTSRMGSIADNGSGGSYLYRSAKAGLNAAARSLAIDLAEQQIAVLLLHPGWVRTDMGGASAPLQIDESVTGMLARIADLELSNSGSFLDWSGAEIPW